MLYLPAGQGMSIYSLGGCSRPSCHTRVGNGRRSPEAALTPGPASVLPLLCRKAAEDARQRLDDPRTR